MVVAGALPSALTSVDEVPGDRCRLQPLERPHAPMAPDKHHGELGRAVADARIPTDSGVTNVQKVKSLTSPNFDRFLA